MLEEENPDLNTKVDKRKITTKDTIFHVLLALIGIGIIGT